MENQQKTQLISAAQYAGLTRKPEHLRTDEEKKQIAEYEEFTNRIVEEARKKRQHEAMMAEQQRQAAEQCTPDWYNQQLRKIHAQHKRWQDERITKILPGTVANYIENAYKMEVALRGGNYIENESCKKAIQEIAQWFVNRPKFGLQIYGYVGMGKSTLAKAAKTFWQLVAKQNCKYLSAAKIADIKNEDAGEWEKTKKHPALFIDDLGTEPVFVKNYGNDTTPLVELISDRYDNMLFTVITTNLSGKEIAERYGERIADRLQEMCSLIVIADEKQKSYRK